VLLPRIALVKGGLLPVPDIYGCLSLLGLTLAMNLLRRAAAARRGPARGRAASRIIIVTIAIKSLIVVTEIFDLKALLRTVVNELNAALVYSVHAMGQPGARALRAAA
jgi:hypothetical protein